jgi:hypothetical protein
MAQGVTTMKHIALAICAIGFITLVAIIEAPSRKPKGGETIHVLPRVEEMPTDPTPFSL